jgi:hypothetical protein
MRLLKFFKLLVEIHIIYAGYELVGLRVSSSVRSLDLAVEPRGSRLDVTMFNAQIPQVSVEKGLELMPPIGPDVRILKWDLLMNKGLGFPCRGWGGVPLGQEKTPTNNAPRVVLA